MFVPIKLAPDPKASGWKPQAGWYIFDTIKLVSDIRVRFSNKRDAQTECERKAARS